MIPWFTTYCSMSLSIYGCVTHLAWSSFLMPFVWFSVNKQTHRRCGDIAQSWHKKGPLSVTLQAATGLDVKVKAHSNCDYSNAHWVSSLFNLCRAYSITMIWSPHRIVSFGWPRTHCSAAGDAAAAVTLVFLKDHLGDVRGLNKHVPGVFTWATKSKFDRSR